MITTTRTILLNVLPRVYLNEAPDDAKFPYIVIDFDASIYQRPIEVTSLNVHIWDRGQSIETILELEKQVIKELDTILSTDGNKTIVFYLDRILKSGTEERTLKRKTVIFEVRSTERI